MTRLVATAIVILVATACTGLVFARTTGDCVGQCKRLDNNGNCRTVYNCGGDNQQDNALTSIFAPTPCRQKCYAYVRGRCRLRFSCLLG